jgi:hypothetical protein
VCHFSHVYAPPPAPACLPPRPLGVCVVGGCYSMTLDAPDAPPACPLALLCYLRQWERYHIAISREVRANLATLPQHWRVHTQQPMVNRKQMRLSQNRLKIAWDQVQQRSKGRRDFRTLQLKT